MKKERKSNSSSIISMGNKKLDNFIRRSDSPPECSRSSDDRRKRLGIRSDGGIVDDRAATVIVRII